MVGAEREPMTGEPPQAADPLQQSAEPQAAGMPPSDGPGNLLVLAPNIAAVLRRTGQVWSDQGVLQAIRARLREHQAMNSTAVYDEDRALYRAATRRHGNWSNALLAAGLNPDEFRKPGGRPRVR